MRVGKVFLSILNTRSYDARNQDIDDRFELLKLLDVSELGNKADFLLDLVPICVVRPKEDVEGYSDALPRNLNGLVFFFLSGICNVLDCRQANV